MPNDGRRCSRARCATLATGIVAAVATSAAATGVAAKPACAGVAAGATTIVTAPAAGDPNTGYASIVHAVYAARRFLAASAATDREYVGAVLCDGAGRCFLTVGIGPPSGDRVTFAIRHGGGRRVVALWHTHGAAGPARELFSPADRELARAVGLPFYLLTPTGEVRVLRPDAPGEGQLSVQVDGETLRAPAGSARGEGVPPPDSEVLLARQDATPAQH